MDSNNLESICKPLGDITTGSKLTHMFESLGLSNTDENGTKWKRIFNSLSEDWNVTHSYDKLIKVIEWIMSPSLHTDEKAKYEETRDRLNVALSFIGLKLLENGKVIHRQKVETIDEALETVKRLKSDLQKFNIHKEILEFCKPEIISEDLFHLVFEASKCVLQKLRDISGLDTDGNKLVNQCFDGNNPLVFMNTLRTDDEKSEHKGLQALMNAIVYLYRNPKAHHLRYLSVDTYQTTIEALVMISRARYALEHCQRNNPR